MRFLINLKIKSKAKSNFFAFKAHFPLLSHNETVHRFPLSALHNKPTRDVVISTLSALNLLYSTLHTMEITH